MRDAWSGYEIRVLDAGGLCQRLIWMFAVDDDDALRDALRFTDGGLVEVWRAGIMIAKRITLVEQLSWLRPKAA